MHVWRLKSHEQWLVDSGQWVVVSKSKESDH